MDDESLKNSGNNNKATEDIKFYFDINRKPGKPKIDVYGRAHYRELNYVDNVRSGTLLAEKYFSSTVISSDDTTQTSKTPVDKNLVKPGKNVRVSGDGNKFFSEVDGMPLCRDNILEVEPKIDINRDIDYGVGNIDFVGEVHIKGSVRTGFTVKAGKNLFVGGNVSGAKVAADRELNVANGIITGENNYVRAGGQLNARFIENSVVRSGGDTRVRSWILHSDVDCRGKLVVGDAHEEGIIIGGKYVAGIALIADNLGSHYNVKTEIILYFNEDYYKEDELFASYKFLKREVRHKKDIIKKAYFCIENLKDSQKLDLIQKAKLISQFNEKIYDNREELVKIEKEEEEFRKFLIRAGYILEPIVIVRGTVWPGVTIRINNTKLRVNKKFENVAFSYDEGKVTVNNLKEIDYEFNRFC